MIEFRSTQLLGRMMVGAGPRQMQILAGSSHDAPVVQDPWRLPQEKQWLRPESATSSLYSASVQFYAKQRAQDTKRVFSAAHYMQATQGAQWQQRSFGAGSRTHNFGSFGGVSARGLEQRAHTSPLNKSRRPHGGAGGSFNAGGSIVTLGSESSMFQRLGRSAVGRPRPRGTPAVVAPTAAGAGAGGGSTPVLASSSAASHHWDSLRGSDGVIKVLSFREDAEEGGGGGQQEQQENTDQEDLEKKKTQGETI